MSEDEKKYNLGFKLLVFNPKNKCHRIKNTSSKMEKLSISYVVSCYFQTFFSDL